MLTICTVVMAACLGTEGVILVFSGFPLPGAPLHVYAVGIVWAGACGSLFVSAKRPAFTLLAGWALFLVSATLMWLYSSEEKSVLWFLYQHSLELTFLIVPHVGYLLRLSRSRLRSQRQTGNALT